MGVTKRSRSFGERHLQRIVKKVFDRSREDWVERLRITQEKRKNVKKKIVACKRSIGTPNLGTILFLSDFVVFKQKTLPHWWLTVILLRQNALLGIPQG